MCKFRPEFVETKKLNCLKNSKKKSLSYDITAEKTLDCHNIHHLVQTVSKESTAR